MFTNFSAPHAIFEKKQAVFGPFWKILTKKTRFLCARSPSKLLYLFETKEPLEKFLGSVSQKPKTRYLKILQRGTLWVGNKSPKKKASATPPLPRRNIEIHQIFEFDHNFHKPKETCESAILANCIEK